jgi:hypothetical protein
MGDVDVDVDVGVDVNIDTGSISRTHQEFTFLILLTPLRSRHEADRSGRAQKAKPMDSMTAGKLERAAARPNTAPAPLPRCLLPNLDMSREMAS